ncbi:multiubiquitin domain-containing protein [Psychrobacillus sp. FSL H8-0484]|uniref:multiubiquitin domain-containing protein n=1 Tax=unclassified Psychrobacillus TaxID=2636677 RepID=UPI0030FD0F94
MQEEKNEKQVQIIINARPFSVKRGKLSFQEVVRLYYGTFDENPNVVYTVSYKRNIHTPSISMVLGDDVQVIEEMMFSVSKTDKS